MDIYFDRIKPLFDKTGKTAQELGKELGISPRFIYHWNKGESKSYTKYYYQIAKYFKVSVEYLTGATDDPAPTGSTTEMAKEAVALTPDQQRREMMLKLFDRLSPDNQNQAIFEILQKVQSQLDLDTQK